MRKTISLIALFSFVLLLMTSVVLYVMPHGRVAYWADWHLLGLSKTTWDELHITLGSLFVVVGLWHAVLNGPAIVSYLNHRRGELRSRAAVTAVLVTLFVVLETFFHLPPVTWLLDLNTQVKNRASATLGEPPYGHAELSSLAMLIRNAGLDVRLVEQRLAEKHIVFESLDQPVLQVADANGLTPQQLFVLMQPELREGEFPAMPERPPAGLGRKTLKTVCTTYGLDCDALVAMLKEQGWEASAEMTIREIAALQGQNPVALYELIYRFSQ